MIKVLEGKNPLLSSAQIGRIKESHWRHTLAAALSVARSLERRGYSVLVRSDNGGYRVYGLHWREAKRGGR